MPLCNMMAMQHRKNKRGLQQLSDAQKLEAITKVQKGETKAAVAREFGVPESTLRGWCKKAKLNGHCHSVMNKSLQVTSTMSPVLLTSEMAYRDCSYSKGSGSDEGSTTHPFSDEQEDDDTEREAKPPVVAIPIPEEQRRVLDWLNYGHYPQLPVTQQTPPPPPQMIDTTTTTTTTTAAKPAQPVVTSSTCDDVRNVVAKVAKVSSTKKDKAQSIKGPNSISGSIGGGGGGGGGNTNHHHTNNHTIINHINNNNHNNNNNNNNNHHHNHHHHNNNHNNNNSITSNNNNIIINNNNNNNLQQNHQNGVNGFGFYNWCKSNTSCGGYSSPVSPVSSDKNDSYDDEPLALIVPSKRRISDLESALKNQLSKMYQEQQQQQQQQQTNGKQTLSVEEALQHGEVFLDWLRACSDPNVTVLQAMQIGTLIKNIRSSLERNQNRR